MKKVVMSLVAVMVFVGCKSAPKNENVTNETTAAGGTEKVDVSAMSFSPAGSDSGTIEGLQTVHFDYDKSSLTETEQKKLDGNVAWLKTNAGVKLTIEGHCDQRDSNEYNLSLGERHANTVKQMLVKAGIPAARLSTTSFGEEKPVATGDSEDDMAKNRRANFVPVK